MQKYSYAREKFSAAVDVMATSPKSIQDRLYDAFMTFHPVKAEDFKEPDIRRAFEEIMERLTSVKDDPYQKGLVRVTLDKMSDEEAREVAEKICEFRALLTSV